MEEDDMNVLAIRNFTSEGSGSPYPDYEIDGGPDSLLDLELEECDNFNELEYYNFIIEDMSDIYLGLPNWIYSMSEMRNE